MSEADPIHVLLCKEGDLWVAQCLEYDIGAQARDLDQLRKRLLLAIQAERDESLRRHGKPFAGIAPAPRQFYELWNRRAGEFRPTQPTPSPTPDIDIEYGLAA
jgi:hypothetical protein